MNDDLLVKYLLQETSAEETMLVESWVGANETNRKYFEQLRAVWEESRGLAAVSTVDENAAWQRFQARIKNDDLKRSSRLKAFGWMRIAALFLVIAGVATLAYLVLSKSGPVEQVAVQTRTAVLIDTLPDGSVITLNKHSSISYPEKFSGNKRSVSLKGEAFFHVTPDRKKPFEIEVNDLIVKVVGTSFNIRSEKGETEVIVETGVVQVIRKGKTVELRPGQKVLVKQQDSVIVPQKEAEQLYRYYRSKEFVCDNTPLWKLVQVLNEAYDVNIVIARPGLKSLPLNVTFSNESLDVILEIIKETFNNYNIEVRRTADKISLQ